MYKIAGTDYSGELITNPSGTFSTGITAMGAAVGVYSYTFSSPSGCEYVSAALSYEIVDTASSGGVGGEGSGSSTPATGSGGGGGGSGSGGGGTGAGCVRASPTVVISPDYQEGKRGEEITSSIIVVNNDNSACGPSAFYVWGAAADSEIYADSPPNLLKPRPAISPGGSSTYKLNTRITSYAGEGKTYRTGARVKNAELDYYSAPNYEAYAKVYVKPAAVGACTDSDGGRSYYVKGVVNDGKNSYSDYCSESSVVEMFCDDWGNVAKEQYYCGVGCVDGACLKEKPTPVPVTAKEPVKCVFSNSASEQKCYSDNGGFGCSGVGTCLADVYGDKGIKLTWKSSCGGYAYTVIDGTGEYAEFKCEQPVQSCTDSDGGINYGKKGTLTVNYNPLFEDEGKFSSLTDTCSERTLTEYYCDIKGAAQTAYYTCPYVCEDGACVTEPAKGVCGNGICEPGEAGCPDILCVKAPCPKVLCKVSTCPQDCESRPVPPEKQSYEVKIGKGWNLIGMLPILNIGERLGSSLTKTCSFLQGDSSSGGEVEKYLKANMYGYDAFNNKYVSLADLAGLDSTNRNGYLVNTLYNGYWLRSGENCAIIMDLSSIAKDDEWKVLSQISGNNYKLVKGWNFFSVWPEMEGKTLDDIKGSCDVRNAYAYDSSSNKWTNLAGIKFSHNSVGSGFVLKVANDCVPGPSSTLPPPLPEEGTATAKVAVSNATATKAAAASVAVKG